MKRILAIVAVVVVSLAVSSLMLAQDTDPRVGTWKLNLSKSNFAGMPAPKSETRTIEAQGNGYKVTYDGVAADGSPIAFTFTTNFDGKPVPFSGTGVAGGADMVAVKRIDSHTEASTTTKAGKVVATIRSVVSKDGKVTTQTRRTTDAKGQPITQVLVWDKQ
ncbi:MAG TPA: hypothetical protein VMM16_06850 [Verrucomicrobiae bacterium]|nr:hypothetical protein [Verrucomicrobiae bacterium]